MYETKYGTVDIANAPIELWRLWGFPSWEDYIETELEYHMGTGNSYALIWEVFFVKYKGAWDMELLPKSMTKLRELVKVVNKSSCNAWFRRAAKLTCCQLHDAVDTAIHGGQARRLRTFATHITAKGLDDLNKAINEAREDFGVHERGEALTRIIREWSALRHKAKKIRAVA